MNDQVWASVPSQYAGAVIPDRPFTDKQREVSSGSVIIPNASRHQRPLCSGDLNDRDNQFQQNMSQPQSQYRKTFELIKSDRNPQLQLMQLMFNLAREIATELLDPHCEYMDTGLTPIQVMTGAGKDWGYNLKFRGLRYVSGKPNMTTVILPAEQQDAARISELVCNWKSVQSEEPCAEPGSIHVPDEYVCKRAA